MQDLEPEGFLLQEGAIAVQLLGRGVTERVVQPHRAEPAVPLAVGDAHRLRPGGGEHHLSARPHGQRGGLADLAGERQRLGERGIVFGQQDSHD